MGHTELVLDTLQATNVSNITVVQVQQDQIVIRVASLATGAGKILATADMSFLPLLESPLHLLEFPLLRAAFLLSLSLGNQSLDLAVKPIGFLHTPRSPELSASGAKCMLWLIRQIPAALSLLLLDWVSVCHLIKAVEVR
jgi:hypothetical protein